MFQAKNMNTFMKNRGFTDKLYFCNLLSAWIYTIICVILSVFGGHIGIEDYSFVSVVCPLVWGEVAVHSGFVIWKAKAENMAKKGNTDNITMQ